MAKNNLLLVDLNDKKTKKLAETITSDTSRKILNYLAEKEHDTEANIAKELEIPISTVHYHLQKLQEASLVNVDEFHYSPKGREVNHYQLANKYIIIAPKKVSGLKRALKNVLPIGIIALGISAVIKFVTTFTGKIGVYTAGVKEEAMMESADAVAEVAPIALEKSTQAANFAAERVAGAVIDKPDIALWFFIGSIATILIYLLVVWIKEWRRK